MNNEEKKIIGYDPQTGEPIYEDTIKQPVIENQNNMAQPILTTIEETSKEPKKKNVLIIILLVVGGFLLLAGFGIAILLLGFGNIFMIRNKKVDIPKVEVIEQTFYGETFNIKYKSPWEEKEVKLANNETEKALTYNNGEITLLPLGTSALDETSTANFKTTSGRTQLYNEFYEYWGKTDKLGSGTNGFNILKDDIYYASIEYMRTSNSPNGRLYLIVSDDNNIILSFMSNVTENQTSADEKIISLFKNINIDTLYDNELANMLDSMSNWNRYSNVRSGYLGKKKQITGGWRILGDSEIYWTFYNGEFRYYKSYKDLDDNYFEGTYKLYTGKSGASRVGIDGERIDSIVAKGKVKESDIYTLILTPTKVISDGVDNSSSNIAEGEELHMIWILVDHGKDGIEGQQLNVKTADTSYFVKIKD